MINKENMWHRTTILDFETVLIFWKLEETENKTGLANKRGRDSVWCWTDRRDEEDSNNAVAVPRCRSNWCWRLETDDWRNCEAGSVLPWAWSLEPGGAAVPHACPHRRWTEVAVCGVPGRQFRAVGQPPSSVSVEFRGVEIGDLHEDMITWTSKQNKRRRWTKIVRISQEVMRFYYFVLQYDQPTDYPMQMKNGHASQFPIFWIEQWGMHVWVLNFPKPV